MDTLACRMGNTRKTGRFARILRSPRYGLLSIFFHSVPPPSVHFHLQLISLDTVPSDEEAFKLWLRERWSAKEKRMTAFAREQQFDGEQIVIPVKQL